MATLTVQLPTYLNLQKDRNAKESRAGGKKAGGKKVAKIEQVRVVLNDQITRDSDGLSDFFRLP
jgi:hypothetical protein